MRQVGTGKNPLKEVKCMCAGAKELKERMKISTWPMTNAAVQLPNLFPRPYHPSPSPFNS